MQINRRSRRKIPALVVVPALAIGGFIGSFLFSNINQSQAANLSNFKPGNIMSDYVMSNKNTMSESDISNFLRSKANCNDRNLAKVGGSQTGEYIYRGNFSWHVRDGRFVCLADEVFGGETSAHIIWQTAQDYSINPQVLIVLLQKEQGLITDSFPNNIQYRSATGYGCPDTAPCDSQYYGFRNQVRKAASLFRYVLDGKDNTYYPVGVRYVQYNPNKACGGTNVNIENRATQSLYRYTPYQPNASALAAGYGTGDSCATYGNRNFYLYFTDWFGNTQNPISVAYSNYWSWFGMPVADMQCGLSDNACMQKFQKGIIYWSPSSGVKMILGDIATYWSGQGDLSGFLGKPTTNETKVGGLAWQSFSGGTVFVYSNGDVVIIQNADIAKTYGDYWSWFGKQKTNTFSAGGDVMRQDFEKGTIFASSSNGIVMIQNADIAKTYGDYWSWFGKQVTLVECNLDNDECLQKFEKGIIHRSGDGQTKAVLGDIATYWIEHNDILGRPITGVTNLGYGMTRQSFANGTVFYSANSGVVVTTQKDITKAYNDYWSWLGKQLSETLCEPSNNRCEQRFEKGVVYWSQAAGMKIDTYAQ